MDDVSVMYPGESCAISLRAAAPPVARRTERRSHDFARLPSQLLRLSQVKTRRRTVSSRSVEQFSPVFGHTIGRPRTRLVNGTRRGRRECGAEHVPRGGEVPEPVLTGFEALDNGMAARRRVRARVLGWRTVTAPHMTALRATAQMQPPRAIHLAFGAAGPARWSEHIDSHNGGHAPLWRAHSAARNAL
jgi:hypothetical protein